MNANFDQKPVGNPGEMLSIKKILLPMDFSRCSEQAFSHALYLAKQYGAELHLLHAIVMYENELYCPPYTSSDRREIYHHLKKNAKGKQVELLSSHDVDNVEVKVAQKKGISAAPVIMQYAEDRNIDLIVMGTHGRRGLGHLFLGSITEEVVRCALCPVLTIREKKKETAPHALRSILVPLDFSEHSKVSLLHAKGIANSYHADLRLLHVVEQTTFPVFYPAGMQSILAAKKKAKESSEKVMVSYLEDVGEIKRKEIVSVVEGHAASDIVKYAKDHETDMIVIATHGLTGFQHMLIGSVTEKVVRMAPCPVFVVKAYGKSLVDH